MRKLWILLLVLLSSCEPTGERVPPKYPPKRIVHDAKDLSESFCRYDLEDAIVLLDSVLKNYPDDHLAYWTKLNVLIQLGKTDVAMALIDSTIKKEPHLPGNYFYKGIIYDECRDNVNAIKSYKRDIMLYDQMLDTLKRESGDYKGVIFNKAVDQIYSGNEQGNRTLKGMFAIENDKDLKELISLFVNESREDLIHRNGKGSLDILYPINMNPLSGCINAFGHVFPSY